MVFMKNIICHQKPPWLGGLNGSGMLVWVYEFMLVNLLIGGTFSVLFSVLTIPIYMLTLLLCLVLPQEISCKGGLICLIYQHP